MLAAYVTNAGMLHRTPTDVAILFEFRKATQQSNRDFNATLYFCKSETVFANANPNLKPGTGMTGF